MNKKYIQKNYINLCSKVLGTKIHRFSDQFFGSASRLLKEEQPIFKEEYMIKMGSGWMDGKQEEKELKEMIMLLLN
mgnify:CR=1 FL=1